MLSLVEFAVSRASCKTVRYSYRLQLEAVASVKEYEYTVSELERRKNDADKIWKIAWL